MSVTITKTVRQPVPRHPYEKIAAQILGSSYELSLNFIGRTRAQTLNQAYRGKTYVPNVLSFPLATTVGEIYICPEVAKRQAKKHDMNYSQYVAFLFIHGALHLKGHDHGATMDRLERKHLTAFGIT